MKYVECDGRHLEVRDVGDIIFRLTTTGIPIKAHGTRLMKDDEVCALLRELIDSGLYKGGKVNDATAADVVRHETIGVKLVTG